MGKTSSYQVHTHGIGEITINNDGTFKVKGGHERSTSDKDIQYGREKDGTVNQPSIILGYEVKVNISTTSSINGRTIQKTSKTRTLSSYNGAGQSTTVNYKDFKKAVKNINK